MRLKSLLGLGILVALVGCASAPQKPATAQKVDARAGCIPSGSRIPSSPGQCIATGRSYSSEDLQRTGKTDVGEALQNLDPSLTVNH
jgi:hypothetical protein